MTSVLYKTKEGQVDPDVLKMCFELGSSGAGFAVLKSDGVRVQKSYSKFPKMWKAYIKASMGQQYPTLFSFWSRLSKVKDGDANVMPFAFGNGFAFATTEGEYGIGKMIGEKSEGRIIRDTLHSLYCAAKDTEAFLTLLNNRDFSEPLDQMLNPNRGVVLVPNDDPVFINKSQGYMIEGVWYSHSLIEIKREHTRLVLPKKTIGAQQSMVYPERTPLPPPKEDHSKIPYFKQECVYCKDELSTIAEITDGMCSACYDKHE